MTCESFDSPLNLLASIVAPACRILHDPADSRGKPTEEAIAAWRLESGALYVLDVHGVVVCM